MKNHIINMLRGLDNESLKEINKVLIGILQDRHKRENIAKSLKFHRGDKVKFRDRYGCYIYGTVQKVNQQTIGIQTTADGTNWRVSTGLVEPDPS